MAIEKVVISVRCDECDHTASFVIENLSTEDDHPVRRELSTEDWAVYEEEDLVLCPACYTKRIYSWFNELIDLDDDGNWRLVD